MFQPVVINTKKSVLIQPTNPLRNVVFLSLGDTPNEQGSTTTITQPITQSGYSDFIKKFSNSFFAFSQNTQFAVYELKEYDSGTLQTTLGNLANQYGIMVMTDTLADKSGLNAILKALDIPNNPCLFLIGTTKSFTDNAIVTLAQSFSGLSNTLLCYESATNNAIVGAISGLLASSKFDFNANNPISPIVYTSLQGWKYSALTNETEQTAIANNITYIKELIKIPTLFNLTNMDGNQFLYWYSYKYTATMIKDGITQYMMNSANANRPLQYNQQGIDKLNSNIVGTLKLAQSYGLINQFGIGENNEFSATNIINSIPFATYISNNPTNYANGIYDGFSFSVQIGRYFKQIVLNITIF